MNDHPLTLVLSTLAAIAVAGGVWPVVDTVMNWLVGGVLVLFVLGWLLWWFGGEFLSWWDHHSPSPAETKPKRRGEW